MAASADARSAAPAAARPRGRVDASASRRLSRAIETGVPLFNRGDHRGCADEYEGALGEAVAGGGITGLARDAAEATLRSLPGDDSDRAWCAPPALLARRHSPLPAAPCRWGVVAPSPPPQRSPAYNPAARGEGRGVSD